MQLSQWLSHRANPSILTSALYLRRRQIVPEERELSAKFGAPYAEYAARVRRWL